MSSAFAITIDLGLIRQAQSGDRGAFKAIYEAFEKPAYTLAYRICQCHDAARDVVQESMLMIFRRIGQFRFEAPFWSWVRKVVVNAALMHLRRNGEGQWTAVLIDDVIEDRSDGMGVQRDIETLFARLAPERRAVLWLYAVEGYSHREIGDMMDYTPSYSKSQLLRARRQLRRWWAPDEAMPEELAGEADDDHD